MDVVLSNIKKIGGSVHVRSYPGRGTRMTLRLPLTLAVLDVMLVKVAGSPYVIPLSSIVETIQNSRADFGHMPSGGRVLQTRGEYVQVVDLARQFDIEPCVAMLSFSNFGSTRHPQSEKVQRATELVKARQPDLTVDGSFPMAGSVLTVIYVVGIFIIWLGPETKGLGA